jgi:Leucine-rich repeat (LRR) protein
MKSLYRVFYKRLVINFFLLVVFCANCSGGGKLNEPVAKKSAERGINKQEQVVKKEKNKMVVFTEKHPVAWNRTRIGAKGKYLQFGTYKQKSTRPYLYRYSGEKEISWSVRKGLFRVNGKVVGLDLSEIDIESALKLIEKHGDRIRSVAWINAKSIPSGIVNALVEHSNKKLAISLVDFDGPGEALSKLKPIKHKLDFFYYASSTPTHNPDIKPLGFLKKKTEVSLFVHNMKGNWLKELRVLKNLKRIEAIGIGLGRYCGYFPKMLMQFTDLEVLRASSYRHTNDSFHLERFQKLHTLFLSPHRGDNIEGSALKELSNLQYLGISKLKPEDTTLWWIGKLRELKLLYMSCSFFEKEIGEESYKNISRLPKLGHVQLTGCTIDEKAARIIGTMRNLKRLVLQNTCTSCPNIVKGKALTHLKGLSKLETLILSAIDLSKYSIKSIPVVNKVKRLHMVDSNISDNHLEEISSLDNLEFFSFSSENVTDKGIGNLKKMKNLKYLGIKSWNTTEAGMRGLGILKNLRFLNVAGTKIGDSGIQEISRLPRLKVLSIRNTKITDKGLRYLTGLKTLRTLVLTKDPITQDGIDYFEKNSPNCTIYAD